MTKATQNIKKTSSHPSAKTVDVSAIEALIQGIPLKHHTSQQWVEAVLNDFPLFLADHASNERKAASIAMELVVRYPDKLSLVAVAVQIAQDEIEHFALVFEKMRELGYPLRPDEKCRYARYMHRRSAEGGQERLLDHLMINSMIETRGMERFGLLAIHHPDPQWQNFFKRLSLGEKGHAQVYITEAKKIFKHDLVDQAYEKWLTIEAEASTNYPETYKLFT
ncbi:MAG TPA: tRNA isopentenyl-2-thiomethyl-A-37 hydroxylase MiaE [Oligoflexia bacterium]|nr:tRNA isopentenyl-2-thiomethyl-A-37 hydroxylase MiaE [Oligoflexia bacterium]HMR23941.1 tRNA isopentenyl-2-thiomethyl-A-37 hydroxylase MiaE [Oligoflexia bacterium]